MQNSMERTPIRWASNSGRRLALVIPKGTNHAGMIVTSGPLKFLAFKTPPQDPTDVRFVK